MWIFAVPYNFPGCEHVGYKCLYSWSVILDFNFLRMPCIFDSSGLVGSFSTAVSCFVGNICKHFSVYFYLSITTTPGPLSCFNEIMSSFFDRSEIIFLWVCGTFVFQYFSHVLCNLVFTLLISFSGMLKIPLKRICKNDSNSVVTAFLLMLAGMTVWSIWQCIDFYLW